MIAVPPISGMSSEFAKSIVHIVITKISIILLPKGLFLQYLHRYTKKANAENQQEVSLDATEAYCEACNLKLSGEMNISVEYKLKNDEQTHIESSGHLTRLKVIFKNDLYSSSRIY